MGEAIAAGTLLFQEADNREVPLLLTDREECVFYDADNLFDLLNHYLAHEDERRRIAANARQRLNEFSFEHLWQTQMQSLEADMPMLRERAERRCAKGALPDLRTRVWTQLSSTFGYDTTLKGDLTQTVQEHPRDSHSYNALGALASLANAAPDRIDAANAFQEAWRSDPRHVVAGLNLAETLIALGQPQHAIEQAVRTLAMIDELEPVDADVPDAPHVPVGFDWFRVEWERAAWMNPGQPANEVQAKITLLRWRLHSLLAELHDDLPHAFIATSLRPELPVSQASLGCALARKGRIREAIPYLRDALTANPFDIEAARACYEALRQAGLFGQQQRLAKKRRDLSAAAPSLVPTEPWFAESPTPAIATEPGTTSPLRIFWHGSQEALHSLAGVNREICVRLIDHGHELALQPARLGDPPGTRVPLSRSAGVIVGTHVRSRLPSTYR